MLVISGFNINETSETQEIFVGSHWKYKRKNLLNQMNMQTVFTSS